MFVKKPAKVFSHHTDVKLIRLVRDNPVLYNHKHEKYMDCNSKEVAWQKIGDELKRPAADCKMRWVNIRDVNRRIIRKSIQNPSLKITSYKYQNELQFMRPFYRDILYIPEDESGGNLDDNNVDYPVFEESHDNHYESEQEEVDDPITIVKQEKKSRKRKRKSSPATFATANETSELDGSDPVDTFLKTIGATLKTFSPYRLNLAKTQIFTIVQEHDLQQIMHNQKGVSDDGEAIS